MQKTKKLLITGFAVSTLCFLSATPVVARQSSTIQQYPPSLGQAPHDTGKSDPSDSRERFEEQSAKARNNERFKRIQTDTGKLLELSTELKADVDKSTKNEMSLDVIRKAAEIEKLAHDVKERMKG